MRLSTDEERALAQEIYARLGLGDPTELSLWAQGMFFSSSQRGPQSVVLHLLRQDVLPHFPNDPQCSLAWRQRPTVWMALSEIDDVHLWFPQLRLCFRCLSERMGQLAVERRQ